MLSKEQEMQQWNTFRDSLEEDGYLDMTLKGMDEYIKANIDNDFGTNPIDLLAESTAEAAACRGELRACQEEISDLQKQLKTLQSKLEEEDKKLLEQEILQLKAELYDYMKKKKNNIFHLTRSVSSGTIPIHERRTRK